MKFARQPDRVVDPRSPEGRWGPWLMLAFGLALVMIGVAGFALERAYDRFGRQAIGRVTYSGSLGLGTGIQYRFEPAGAAPRAGSDRAFRAEVGAPVEVVYLPALPAFHRAVNAYERSRLLYMPVAAIGGLAFALGLKWRRQSRTAASRAPD